MLKLFLAILLDTRGATLAITRVTANTLITASATNNRCTEIEAVVNALTATNYANDSVGAAALNSDVVRTNYGLVQHTDGSLYVDVSDTNPGLEITDGGLRVKVDDSSIERASGGLQVKASGITNAMLAGSIADAKLVETYFNATRHDADDHSSFDYASMGTGILGKTKGGTGIATSMIVYGTFDTSGSPAQGTAVAHGLGAKPAAVFWFPSSNSAGSGDWGMWIEGMGTNCCRSGGSITSITTEPNSTNFYLPESGDGNSANSTYKFIAIKSN